MHLHHVQMPSAHKVHHLNIQMSTTIFLLFTRLSQQKQRGTCRGNTLEFLKAPQMIFAAGLKSQSSYHCSSNEDFPATSPLYKIKCHQKFSSAPDLILSAP